MCPGWMKSLLAGLLLLPGVLSEHAAWAAETPEFSFTTQAQLGNIFTVGEPVAIEAAVATGASIRWTVADFEGQTVASGSTGVAEKRIRIRPNVATPGFYTVRFVSKVGEEVKGQGQTTFAIVPPADITKMPGSRFAVMSHFNKGMPADILPLVARAGITSVRDECEWNSFEKSRGSFVTPPSVQAYMPRLAELKIEPLMVLAFGNRNHYTGPAVPDHKKAPYDAAGYAAYSSYCLEVLKRFSSQVKTVEIWNEYNGTFCDGPAAKNRPKYYTEMLKHSNAAIKAAYPEVKVVGGALVKIPMPYIEKLFKEGALQHMDAIAVHPYRGTPEGVEKELASLAQLMRKYNNGVAKPIWVTETGSWRDSTPERATTAEYLVRMMTLMLTEPKVERIYWYLLCDFIEFKTMGILHGADDPSGRFTPTMVYPTYANLIHRLYGSEFRGRETTDARTRVYRFERGREVIWVCWSTSGDTMISLATASPVKRINMVGGEEALVSNGKAIFVSVGQRPFYLVSGKDAIVTEPPRPSQIIADSTEDFAATQGEHGWSYLYFTSSADGRTKYEPAGTVAMKWEASRGDWDDQWGGPAPYLVLGDGGGQPSVKEGRQIWAVRRWTSTVDGPVQLEGQVTRGAAGGDGVVCKVYVGANEILSRKVLPMGREEFTLPVTLRKGDMVDFILTPGDGTDTGYDATAFRATILETNRPISP